MTKIAKKCSTDQRFIQKRNTIYKIHTLVPNFKPQMFETFKTETDFRLENSLSCKKDKVCWSGIIFWFFGFATFFQPKTQIGCRLKPRLISKTVKHCQPKFSVSPLHSAALPILFDFHALATSRDIATTSIVFLIPYVIHRLSHEKAMKYSSNKITMT